MEEIKYIITFRRKLNGSPEQELVIGIYDFIDQLRILVQADYRIISVRLKEEKNERPVL